MVGYPTARGRARFKEELVKQNPTADGRLDLLPAGGPDMHKGLENRSQPCKVGLDLLDTVGRISAAVWVKTCVNGLG